MEKRISIFAFLCLLCFLFGMASCDSSDGPQTRDQEEQIKYLTDAGVPQDYLERRTSHEIDVLFELAQTHTLVGASSCDSSDGPQTRDQEEQIKYLTDAGVPQDYLERRTSHEIDVLFELAQTHTLVGASSCDSSDGSQTRNQDEQIQYLAGAGVPQDYLSRRTSHEIDVLFEMAQTHTLRYFAIDVPYAESDSLALGTIPATDMVFRVEGMQAEKPALPGSPSILTDVLITIEYSWYLGHPMVQKEDAIVVNWDSSLFILADNTFHSADYRYLPMSSVTMTLNEHSNPADIIQGGLGYYANLYNIPSNPATPIVFSGNASFLLKARTKLYASDTYPSSVKYTPIGAKYTHDKNPVGLGLSFSYGGFGSSVSPGPLQDTVGGSYQIKYSMPN